MEKLDNNNSISKFELELENKNRADEINELAVKEAIKNLLMNKKTVVMIAHTLSIVQKADQIIVVSGGQIVESGTHDELINKNGKYAAMCRVEKNLI